MLARKFGRKKAHREHMLKNLAASVILHESVSTTEAKAKEVRRYIERAITIAKQHNLASRRLLLSRFFDSAVAAKLESLTQDRYLNQDSGFTKVVKTGFRHGDGTSAATISLNQPKNPVQAVKTAKSVSAKTVNQPTQTEQPDQPDQPDQSES
ncbi:MAG: large subunit ribosomal protein L17 [Candidatus Berkelbacteria bacterium Gr01-1014_85]|uniref:50S ribosomal protein L17 n=1 Tax=Candidatus Berkelbacteria bacterium Gr01-1014_85 TaxID=2017150 RepID=A0A554JB04_9BACT|nr:MAG: large subunit ribosomal protein L17 [Candidatus Berkelbacteria bacterium Gr01-1014_85]